MAAKSKKRKSTKQTKKNTQQSFVRDEIIIWVTLAVSILMLISNFGIGGFVGEAISDFLFRIFGWIAFVMPFILFGAVAFVISNKGNLHAYMKVATCLILMVLVCTFLQLVDEKGGMLGNILVDVLVPAIGIAGTYVVDVILMIICLVIITGKSALKGVKAQGGKAYDKARKDAERRREQAQERRKIKEAQPKKSRSGKRSEKHVEGVSFDTTIAKKSPNVKELTIDPMEEDRMQEPDTHAVKEPGFVINRGDMPSTVSEPEAEPVMEAAPFDETPVPRKRSKMASADVASEVADVAASVAASATKPKKAYQYPPISLLKRGSKQSGESDAHLRETAMKLQQTLQNFGVNVTVTNVSCGPSVTRYELQPEMGVKVSKIVGLADDIKLNLAAADIRIEAPIPGKAAVGIEVPNKENSAVMLRDLLESKEFKNSASKISFAAGKDIGGKVVVADIAKMPHLLIAGATGSGKSVCINTLIMSIIYKADPADVKLIMVDPKVVELSVYNGIPHLLIPVVTDPKKASGALNWAVAEMTDRYKKFAECNVRDLKGYNERVAKLDDIDDDKKPKKLPQIVIIIDELADLMMVAPGEVEDSICRLAQLARAAGIHLVIATQRPSVNVITGLIKANVPSRIAFSVSSGVDSRTIIDMNGAEKLLGKGDMLFYPAGFPKPQRVQGAFVSDEEVSRVVEFLTEQGMVAEYSQEVVNKVASPSMDGGSSGADRDELFAQAGAFIIEKDKASIGMLQRAFKIGFNRAARIMDQLAEAGVVGEEEGTKPRKILMSPEQFEEMMEQGY